MMISRPPQLDRFRGLRVDQHRTEVRNPVEQEVVEQAEVRSQRRWGTVSLQSGFATTSSRPPHD